MNKTCKYKNFVRSTTKIYCIYINAHRSALLYPILTEKGISQQISDLFEILERIAFPLFSFFLVEGFFKTRNRWKYLSHLLIFGIISEILYDLFQSVVLFELNSNNVMFTLALSLVTIWIIDVLKKKRKKEKINIFGILSCL